MVRQMERPIFDNDVIVPDFLGDIWWLSAGRIVNHSDGNRFKYRDARYVRPGRANRNHATTRQIQRRAARTSRRHGQ